MDVRALIATAERLEQEPPESDLPEWMDDEDESVSTALGWRVSAGSLDWAMSRLATLRGQVENIEAQKRAAIERIEKRASQLTERLLRGVRFFEFRLAEYANAERRALLGGGKKKSLDLLHGRIGWRSKGGKLVVEDRDVLCAWLEQQPIESGLYRVKVEPEMRAIQDRFKAAGEIPPGMVYQPAEEVFYVEPISHEMVTP